MAGPRSETDCRTDTIRFVLDGEVIELENVDPTRTVLQYLREDLRRTGTKEGCAEGDCGACTIVVAELNRDCDDLTLRAINSCIQFLPTLDGKELITVESLNRPGNDLHPVQKAMVDYDGSQCGFCTPGFVMSLFALYKTNAEPTRLEIDDALAGNLCRCTGYRPIIAAARAMYDEKSDADDWLRQASGKANKPNARLQQLQLLSRDAGLAIENNGRRFLAPASCEELADVLAKYPNAILLAGGTDVGLWVTKQHRELETVVYTGRVDALTKLNVDATHIDVGAAVTFTDAMEVIVAHYPELDELFKRFASPPIRNAATLGGNIANGSPIGDSMPALVVARTTLVLRSKQGSREVALNDFYIDYEVKDLQPGEFVERIRIPLPTKGSVLRSHKLSKRFDQDISAVCSAYYLELDGDRVKSFRMACGGLAAIIKRATHCEAVMEGALWNAETIALASAELAKDFTPITDMRASADYRLRGAQNLLRRFYLEISGELEQTVYMYGRQV